MGIPIATWVTVVKLFQEGKKLVEAQENPLSRAIDATAEEFEKFPALSDQLGDVFSDKRWRQYVEEDSLVAESTKLAQGLIKLGNFDDGQNTLSSAVEVMSLFLKKLDEETLGGPLSYHDKKDAQRTLVISEQLDQLSATVMEGLESRRKIELIEVKLIIAENFFYRLELHKAIFEEFKEVQIRGGEWWLDDTDIIFENAIRLQQELAGKLESYMDDIKSVSFALHHLVTQYVELDGATLRYMERFRLMGDLDKFYSDYSRRIGLLTDIMQQIETLGVERS